MNYFIDPTVAIDTFGHKPFAAWPTGTVTIWSLAPGLMDIPNGWAMYGYESLVMPEGDDDEGVNPYQPDLFRAVMIIKL